MQNVWRADKPQKEDTENFQCDADIVGTKSLLCELNLYNFMMMFSQS